MYKKTFVRKNYRLYKVKKQWVTACATFLLIFGATAVVNTSVHADDQQQGERKPADIKDTQLSISPQVNSAVLNNSLPKQATEAKLAEQVSEQPVVSPPLSHFDRYETRDNSSSNNNVTPSDNLNNVQKNIPVTPHAAVSENIAPIAWTVDDGTLVMAGTDMTTVNPADLLQNGQALLDSGAKISWDEIPQNPTQEGLIDGTNYSGKVKVTYADGKSSVVDVSFTPEGQAELNQSHFYYVPQVGQNIDPVTTADPYGTVIYNPSNMGVQSNSLLSGNYLVDANALEIDKLVKPLDTSKIGIHWFDVQVTDNGMWEDQNGNSHQLIGQRTYTVKLPYLVKTLEVRDDIPLDNGNPVINAQLNVYSDTAANSQLAFNPTGMNYTAIGEYFYKDYALAYALGIRTAVTDFQQPTDLKNAKTNQFKLNLTNGSSNLTGADSLEIKVNYVAQPVIAPLPIFNNQGKTNGYVINRLPNQNEIIRLINGGHFNDLAHLILPDGQVIAAKKMENATFGMTDGMASGRFAGTANLQFGGVNSAGQPVVFADNIFSATGTAGASEQFIKDLAHWYKVTNNQASAEQQFGQGGLLNWREIPETAYVMAPPQPKDGETTQIVDVSNGPIELNEQTVEQLVMMTDKDNIPDSWHWPNNSVPNVPADGQWPKGTKFEWLNDSGQGSKLTLNKAGEKATGQIKVTLPSGSSYTIPNITVVSKANVITKSETIDFGTKLTAEDLVTNTSAFPEGTTFQFVGGEPDWNKPGNYMDVAITATYTGPDGKPITTQVSHSNVAINDSRTINILEGTTMPSADQILSLPSDWASHTIQWTDEVTDSTKSREGEITVHYNDSGLDQTIKVYVNVLPKTTPINGLDFYTNGKQIVDTSTASTITDGSIFSNAHNNAVDYEGYDKVTTTPGQPSNHPFGILNYKPSYEVTGLAKNADGSYVSGEQVATVRVYVPEVKSGPMYGFQHDDKGYYYTIQPKLNVAQKVQFEFIDTDNNDAVIGDVHSQEFIPGKNTPLDFSMKMPDHYELVPGNSIPNPYTLPAFTNDQVVVKIPIRQRMHFTISYVDDDTLENGKPKVLYSTDLQDLNNDGYSVFDLNLPGGTGNYYSVSADGVPAESTVAGLYWVPFTDSNCTFSVPNYRWNDQRTLLGANVIVHLKHKVNTVTQNEQRSATVHYVYGNGSNAGQAADQASTAAFYFTREKTHDEVTGQDTYTDWKFDDKFNNENFKNGIQAQTGTWTYDNGQVKVTLPPVDGYTVFTSGDWTDNTNAMSFNLSNKDTLTAAASDYQQKNDHAVYFVAAEEETRTITEYYKAVNDDGTPGEEIYSPSQLDVYFKKGPTEFATNGQTDPNKFSIEFAKDWSTKYDPNDSKEFKVVSGSWITGATPRNWFPAINGYQVKNIVTVDGYYDASVFSLNGNMNIVFTDKGTGEFAKSQTLYYVKNSQLQQDRTRTIEVYVPGKDASETDAEEISLTRSFNAISNNKGVQFTDWDTGSWNESNAGGEVPGYDRIIKVSIDNGQTWQSGTVADLSKVNVTDETKNMLVKVTYTATATADLSGNEQKTYTGKEFTLDDYGLQLNVTGPTAGKEAYKLRPGDIEFLADGETSWTNNLPKNVGTYKIRLTKSGIRNIEAYYGNNSIVWTKDGQSTIGGEAVFKVVQADATADLNDTSSKIYNDQPVKIEEINKVDFNARLGQPVIKQAQKSDYYRQSLDSSNQLPKTGNEEHNIIVYAGLALFGFTSILALFKKRHI